MFVAPGCPAFVHHNMLQVDDMSMMVLSLIGNTSLDVMHEDL